MRKRQGLKLGLCFGVLGLCVSLTRLGAHLEEDTALDWLFKLRGSRAAPSEVVVIAIDKESAEQLGLPN
ncbi:MAG: hypothetical protein ACREV9_09090 [Burkholderiales bacterium]